MKIAVILANYNHAAFIAQALEGVLSQTYQNWQLWVVDDGSTDDSWAIIERYRDRDSRIIAEKLPHNRGAHAAVRRCLELCSGELVCLLAADDYISNPRYFELVVAALQRFPQAAVAYARTAVIAGDDGRPLGLMGSYIPGRRGHAWVEASAMGIPMRFIPPQEALTRFVSHHMVIPGFSAIAKRASMAELGDFDEALGPQSDYFLFHALAALHGTVFIDTPVAVMRMSKSTYSGSANDEDYFRRHALVEEKLRTLPLPYETDERLWAQFRKATINCRTAEASQRRLFEMVRGYCGSVPPDQLEMFPSEPAAFVNSLQKGCARLETALNDQIERGRQIFNEVAGPIAALPSDLESGPRPWLKPVAEFFLTAGRVLGNALTNFGNWLWKA